MIGMTDLKNANAAMEALHNECEGDPERRAASVGLDYEAIHSFADYMATRCGVPFVSLSDYAVGIAVGVQVGALAAQAAETTEASGA